MSDSKQAPLPPPLKPHVRVIAPHDFQVRDCRNDSRDNSLIITPFQPAGNKLSTVLYLVLERADGTRVPYHVRTNGTTLSFVRNGDAEDGKAETVQKDSD